MRRASAILLCAVLAGAGCGEGDDGEPRARGGDTPTATPTAAAEGCADRETLRARDLIGSPPRGFRVVKGDQRAIGAYAGQYRRFLGDRWRGYDARVVVRRGATSGVGVIVLNSTEDVGPSSELIEGAREGERDSGRDAGVRPIDVAGEEGVLSKAPDGAYTVIARAGSCALVVLVADTERVVRDVVPMLRPAR